jgi:hypothetical protein
MMMTIEPFDAVVRRSFSGARLPHDGQEDNFSSNDPMQFEDNRTNGNTTATESPVAKFECEDSSFDIRPIVGGQDHSNMRMRFLQKLTHQRVWLNPI